MRLSVERVLRSYPSWPQWLAAIEIGLLSFVIGIMNGWTSPYLARLTSSDSELPITNDEASWVASFLNVGRMLGAGIGGSAQYFTGSKRTLLCTGIPTALGWMCMLAANSVPWLYVARLSCGIGMGAFFASYPLFMGEISNPKIRGSLAGFIMSCMPIGVLVGSVMGPYISLQLFAGISLVPNLIYLCLFFLLPESPHYLTRRKDYDKASKALQWYQREVDVNSEMDSLKEFVKMKESQTLMDILKEMNLRQNRKAMLIVNMLFFCMQLSGIHSIYFYMEIILRNAQVTAIVPATLVYVVSVVGIVAGWAALHAIDKYGRRIMMVVSSAGTAVSLTLFACHYALLRADCCDPEKLQWFSIMATICFQVFVCIGISPIPSTMLGELFPPNIKSTAACIISVFAGLYAFISSKTYQPLVDVIHEEFVFLTYSVLMIMQVFLCLCCIPETKGKSLQEIQEMLSKHKSERKCCCL